MQNYVSDELTHFVGRRLSVPDQYALLVKILEEQELRSPNMQAGGGMILGISDKPLSSNEAYEPSVVCFCDIPVNELSIHIQKYGQFGISFTKTYLKGIGANPVFYVAQDAVAHDLSLGFMRFELPGKRPTNTAAFDSLHSDLRKHLDSLMKHYFDIDPPKKVPGGEIGSPLAHRVLMFQYRMASLVWSHVKFFDSSLPDEHPENYYMEREWRVFGLVRFNHSDISRVIIPENFKSQFFADVPSLAEKVYTPH